jgi:uncharacterized protein (TIGR03437 family)
MLRSLKMSRQLFSNRRARWTTLALLSLLLCGAWLAHWQGISQAAANFTGLSGFAAPSITTPPTAAPALLAVKATVAAQPAPADTQQGCTVGCEATVPGTGNTGQPVAFQAAANASGCATTPTYDWDFGDGTPRSNQQNPNKTYDTAGTYNWRLMVSVSSGGTNIDTVAGGAGDGAPAKLSPYISPLAVARDPQNRGVYVVDQGAGTYSLRFINTTNGSVTLAGKEIAAGLNRVLVGYGNDDLIDNLPGNQVSLFDTNGIAVHPSGNLVFFVAQLPARVRALNVSGSQQTFAGKSIGVGNVSTVAEIPDADGLNGLAVNANGDLFVAAAATGTNRVYRITAAGAVSNYAGNGAATNKDQPFTPGPANNIPLLTPRAVELDPAGNLYIADAGHQRIIRVDTSGIASLVVQLTVPSIGIGPYPNGLAWFNGNLYTALGNSQTIVRVTNGQAIVAGKDNQSCDYSSNNCGDGGTATNASFFLLGSSGTPALTNIAADQTGIYIPDQGSIQRGRIRYVNLSNQAVTLAGTTIGPNQVNTIAGSGLASPYDGSPALAGALSVANGVTVDANNNLWISDSSTSRIRFVNRSAAQLTLFAGTPAAKIVPAGAIVSVNKDVGTGQTDNTPANQGGFDTPQGLFANAQGLFIADSKGGPAVGINQNARRTGKLRFINTTANTVTLFPASGSPITVPAGFVRTIAGGSEDAGGIGNGNFALNAKFLAPEDVAVASNGDIYVADAGNKAVRKILGTTGIVSSLNLPAAEYTGLALDGTGRLYIVNNDNGQILRETAAGSGSFNVLGTVTKPHDVAVDATGNAYVTSADHKIFRISSTGAVSTLAGTTAGFDGDGGPAANAKLNIAPTQIGIGTLTPQPFVDVTVGIAINAAGEVFFNDITNNRVRRIGTGEVTCVRTGTITIQGGSNPVPTLTSLSPNARGMGSGAFTLTVTGSGFVQSSQVRWNGEGRQTTFISPTQLTAAIPASDLTSVGPVQVTVFNPEPGGGTSAALPFTVQAANPVPAITGITPNTAAVGTAFTLTINGSNFINGSVIRWEGANRTTTFVNETTLRTEIPASDLTAAGTRDITVFNPEPGGGTSNLARFTITAQNAAPTLTSLQPAFAPVTPANGSAYTVTVNGTGFAINSRVRVNGQDRPTTYLGATQLTAQIPPADLGSAGTLNITVFTPTPGGGVTAALPLTVGTLNVSVSAASFVPHEASSEMIMAMFGVELATGVKVADSVPLPTTLEGTTVKVIDSTGTERLAPLFFVAPGQINYLVPAGTANGTATVVVTAGNNKLSVGTLTVQPVAPSLFTANANGQGVPAAVLFRARASGQQTIEELSTTGPSGNRVPLPIDLGPEGDQVFLILFGTGIRGRSPAQVVCTIGGVATEVPFAAAQGGLVGLDQLNIGAVSRSLIGRGTVDLIINVDGKEANKVQVAFR